MEWITSEDLAGTERAAAEFIASKLTQAVGERGRATLAISGGRSPWRMLDQLAAQAVPWSGVHLYQVDERLAPFDDEARNWTHFLASALAARIPQAQRHAVPVERGDAELVAAEYAATVMQICGAPPVFDVVHLGLGADGHTASLFAGDPLLKEGELDVGVSQLYNGLRRVTLTLPALNRARCVVWYVVGAARQPATTRLFRADPAIPASHVQRERATCFTDPHAAPSA